MELFPFFHQIFKILILFVLYFKNYKRQMVSWNCKHVQHVKIYLYLPCNFEVNLITHLGDIAHFSSFFIKILILFVLYFKNYLEIDVKFKLQKCAACQDHLLCNFEVNPITHFDRLCKLEKRGDEIKKKSFPLKLLIQSQPNFAEMILRWFPFKLCPSAPSYIQDGRHY